MKVINLEQVEILKNHRKNMLILIKKTRNFNTSFKFEQEVFLINIFFKRLKIK